MGELFFQTSSDVNAVIGILERPPSCKEFIENSAHTIDVRRQVQWETKDLLG